MRAKLTEDFIDKYCKEKQYTVKKTPNDKFLRIDVSNLVETIPLTLYSTGTLTVGGKPSTKLNQEFQGIKKQITETPEVLGGENPRPIRACAAKYHVLLPETREKIKDALSTSGNVVKIYENPTPSELYRVKLTSGEMALSATQYKNGTLFLQGKDDNLFSTVCEIVETNGTPSEKELVARFLAANEESLRMFTAACTPELLQYAETAVRENLGNEIFNFLENHDQKWLIAAECLRIANVPLPEFSPIVMPASKAFEGFIKKLLTTVGFYPTNHFDSKTATFSPINDVTNPTRIAFVAREKYADTHLKKISVCLDTSRNFMMHSDGAVITKLDTYEEAVAKLEGIYDDVKEIFDYFKKSAIFGL